MYSPVSKYKRHRPKLGGRGLRGGFGEEFLGLLQVALSQIRLAESVERGRMLRLELDALLERLRWLFRYRRR